MTRFERGEAYWIWVDIDGNGNSWRLAVVNDDAIDPEQMLLFPLDAAFEDFAENYEEDPIRRAYEPPGTPDEIGAVMSLETATSRVALASDEDGPQHRASCMRLLGYDWRPISDAPQDQPILCWDGTSGAMCQWNDGVWRIIGSDGVMKPSKWLPVPSTTEGRRSKKSSSAKSDISAGR